jgi:hypothetical protein
MSMSTQPEANGRIEMTIETRKGTAVITGIEDFGAGHLSAQQRTLGIPCKSAAPGIRIDLELDVVSIAKTS